MEKDNLKTLLDYLIFLQPQIGCLINMEDITIHQAELTELERLAEIGRATEKAFIYFSMGQPSENGTIEFDILDVESLLDWAKED